MKHLTLLPPTYLCFEQSKLKTKIYQSHQPFVTQCLSLDLPSPQTLFLPTTQAYVLYDGMSKSAGPCKWQLSSPAGKETPHLLELILLFWQGQRPPPGEFWVKLYSSWPLGKGPHLFLLSPMSLLLDLLAPLFSTCSLALLLSSAFQETILKIKQLTLLLFLRLLVPRENRSTSLHCWGFPQVDGWRKVVHSSWRHSEPVEVPAVLSPISFCSFSMPEEHKRPHRGGVHPDKQSHMHHYKVTFIVSQIPSHPARGRISH